MKELNITKNEENQRLDKFLLKFLNTAPKSFVFKMLRKKNIKLNDKKAEGNEILQIGDVVAVYLADETVDKFCSARAVNLDASAIDIVFEDENILICNKSFNTLSHPENATDKNTLIDQILSYLSAKGEFDTSKLSTFTPAIVNRLDRNTTGIVVCGKNLGALQWLNLAIANKNVDKKYLAVVCGQVAQSGVLESYLEKDGKTNLVQIVEQTQVGKPIETRFERIGANKGFSMVSITLITGKSHQIRAHFASINAPILGDLKYGNKQINDRLKKEIGVCRQLLHANKITFLQKEGVLSYLCDKTFVATPPKDFQKAVKYLNL